ncbi:MAG: hypothetical protein U1E62_26595 [Alsobacter sp.]
MSDEDEVRQLFYAAGLTDADADAYVNEFGSVATARWAHEIDLLADIKRHTPSNSAVRFQALAALALYRSSRPVRALLYAHWIEGRRSEYRSPATMGAH